MQVRKAGWWVGVSLMLATMGHAAIAQETKPAAPAEAHDFDDLDKNHDGVISRSEVPKDMGELRAHFDQYDGNHDHRLSRGEYMAALQSIAAGACRDDQKMATAGCSLGYKDGSEGMRQEFNRGPVQGVALPTRGSTGR